MALHDYGKALLLALVIISVTVLAVFGVLPGDSTERVIVLVLGYLVGNGRAAVRGGTPSPVIGPSGPQLPQPSPADPYNYP